MPDVNPIITDIFEYININRVFQATLLQRRCDTDRAFEVDLFGQNLILVAFIRKIYRDFLANESGENMRFKLFLSVTIFLIGILPCAASVRCDLCQKAMSREYFVFQSNSTEMTVCEDCKNTTGRCYSCGMPTAGTREGDRDVICRSCSRTAARCDACGNVLTRVYFKNSHGNTFCSGCNESADRCSLCRSILLPGKWLHDSGRQVCHTCHDDTPRCTGCHDYISGRYSVFKGFEGQFCMTCVEQTDSCISCLRPTGDRPVRMNNGNSLCRECAATAVSTKTGLRNVINQVSRYLERDMLMNINTKINFELVDDLGKPIRSDHYRESGRFIRRGNDFTIQILRGLSQPICIETVAHELAHAWQAENAPYLSGDELIEGFAQWVAGRVLTGMGYSDLVVRLHYRDDVYGRGYNRLMNMEQRLGFAGVFREIKRLGKAP